MSSSAYNEYTKLSSYLKDQQFGPKSSVPVPNMAFSIIPQYHTNYGFNTLTHDNNNVGYYNIETGYGQKCETFNIASCPSNVPMRPFILPKPEPSPSPSIYSSILRENYGSHSSAIKALDIHVFTQDNCHYCTEVKKMIQLHQLPIQVHDLKDPKNLQLFKKYNGQGVPFFVSTKTHKTHTGLPSNVSVLVAKLSSDNSPSSGNTLRDQIKDLNIILLLSHSCGYCRQLVNLMKSNNANDVVTMYYQDNPEFKKLSEKYRITGYPFIVSLKTGKTITGAPRSIDQLLRSLS